MEQVKNPFQDVGVHVSLLTVKRGLCDHNLWGFATIYKINKIEKLKGQAAVHENIQNIDKSPAAKFY